MVFYPMRYEKEDIQQALKVLREGGIIVYPTDTVWGYWLVYCLPDGLWYLALLLVQQQMVYAKSVVSRAIFAAAIALPFVLEGLQAARLIPGTFDYMDILTYLLTLILFICLKKLF